MLLEFNNNVILFSHRLTIYINFWGEFLMSRTLKGEGTCKVLA